MNYSEIYDSALQLISETPNTASVSDYEARAGYILANMTTILIPIDQMYLQSKNQVVSNPTIRASVELISNFPLSNVLVPAATFYLASMLVLEENEDLSKKLYALYTEEIMNLRSSLTFQSGTTADQYHLLH